jgi:hypothetical protein
MNFMPFAEFFKEYEVLRKPFRSTVLLMILVFFYGQRLDSVQSIGQLPSLQFGFKSCSPEDGNTVV